MKNLFKIDEPLSTKKEVLGDQFNLKKFPKIYWIIKLNFYFVETKK